jgi:acetolactate synthase-1/2/3 large subunit
MQAEKNFSEQISTAEALIRIFEANKVEYVFGIPGGNSMIIYDALYDHRSSIRTILVRHEHLAGVMAEAYGRLSGKPGVALGQGLFMLSNALLGVLEAHLGCSPMIVIGDLTDGAPYSQHAPYQSGTGEYGTWDAKTCFSGATKLTLEAHAPVQALQQVQIAFKHAQSGACGPVALLMHSRALQEPLPPDARPTLYPLHDYRSNPPQPDPKAVEAAAELLGASRQPVIIAGNGIRTAKASAALMRLAVHSGAAVATTASGKGVFPETHPLALGLFGTFGLPAANAFVAEADLVLAVGTKLAPSDTILEHEGLIDPARQQIIQIDIEPKNANWTFPCDLSLCADAAAAMDAVAAVRDFRAASGSGITEQSVEQVAAYRRKYGFFDEQTSSFKELPLLPQQVIAEMQAVCPENTIYTCDAGENRLFMTRFLQTRQPGTFLSPGATGGMGYAIPAALAAKLLYPEQPVVAVCGDGGFAMSMNGLLTSLEESLPIVVVVMNNSMLGWVKHFQHERTIASEFSDVNAAEISRAMGCTGLRAESPESFAEALQTALAGSGPAVVDVKVSGQVSFKDILSPLLGS